MLMQKGHKVELEERIDVLLSGQREVLELLASGEPRDKVLEKLVKSIELQTNGMRCSIVLLDDEGKHIKSCVAPSLPEFYNTALIGFAIGPKAGSCGTAAYRRQPVIVTDIFSDPLWSDYIDLARLSKLRACWSYPIILRDGHVLGTFAMYYHEVRTPTEIEVKLIEEASKIGAAILQQIQMKETFENFISLLNKSKMAFAQSEEKFRKLHENAPEAFVVVNGENFIEAINKRAEVLFGYTSSELMGKPIEILIPERFHASHRSHHSKYAQCPRMRPMGENRDIFGRKKDGSEFAAGTGGKASAGYGFH